MIARCPSATIRRFERHRPAAAVLVMLLPIVASAAAGDIATEAESQDEKPDEPRFAVLVFSKTSGYRHQSIETGIEAIRQLGRDHGFAIEATEDAEAFTDENLARFAAVIFLSTTGDVLDERQ